MRIVLESSSFLPTKGSSFSAGWDLYARENVAIEPNQRKLIDTGVIFELQEGTYGRIAPRSGLSLKGIDVGAGVVDADYRAPIKVLLINNSSNVFYVERGNRIAQFIVEKISMENLEVVNSVDDLTKTERNTGGFGSTGK